MGRLTFTNPGTTVFGTPEIEPETGLLYFDDFSFRGSGFGPMGFALSTSFSGGATGSIAQVTPDSGKFGVLRLTTTLNGTAGAQSGLGAGGFGQNRPFILEQGSTYLMQFHIRCVQWSPHTGTNAFFFFGLSDTGGVAAAPTNAIGWYVDTTSFLGDRVTADPFTRLSGVVTRSANDQNFILSQPDEGVYYTFLCRMFFNGTTWVAEFYKKWTPFKQTGLEGEWVLTATHTTNIPSAVPLFPHIHYLVTGATAGISGTVEYLIDYFFLKEIRNSLRY